MSEFGTELSGKIQKRFLNLLKTDRTLNRVKNRVRDGTDYEIANEYAIRAGELLSQAINAETKTLSYMSEEVAREVLYPVLTLDHALVNTASVQIQQNMNAANGINVSAMSADLDTNRIEGLITKVGSYDTYDAARWVMGEPIVNYSQSTVDYTIRKNMDANARLGMEAQLIRKVDPAETAKGNRACRWCQSLAGTYRYNDVKDTGNEVFRRHRGCRCQLIYKNGKEIKDAWWKTTLQSEDFEENRRLINQRIEQLGGEQQRKTEQVRKPNRMAEYVARQLHYSPEGVRKWFAENRDDINRYGIDYMIDYTRIEANKRKKQILMS